MKYLVFMQGERIDSMLNLASVTSITPGVYLHIEFGKNRWDVAVCSDGGQMAQELAHDIANMQDGDTLKIQVDWITKSAIQ